MKKVITKILAGFEYYSVSDFIQSLLPTLKYQTLLMTFTASALVSFVETVFGITWMAFISFFLVMVFELLSGTYASNIQGIPFSSSKLSRFTFKVACYMVLISVPYIFYINYKTQGNVTASFIFEWLHIFLVVQIIIENILSIIENIAVIQGKPKSFWVDKIKEKVNAIL